MLSACGHSRSPPASQGALRRGGPPGLLLLPSKQRGGAAPSIALAWPVVARVVSPFGRRDGRMHDGIDISVPDGTPVRAAAAGEVAYAGSALRGYGRLLILRHDARVMTIYAHNQRLLVAEGARVARGQVIARSGHSGRATAPHLHFELRIDGVPRDPMRHLSGDLPVPPRRARLDEPPPTARSSRGQRIAAR